ncbi:MAG: 50S ribosomal protein L11 methyltransferase [Myxococcota bacterium]
MISADDIAAIITDRVAAAQSGTQILADRIVFWVPVQDGETALAETRQVIANLAASGLSVDAQGVTMQPAAPEREWKEAWKSHFHISRLTRQLVVVPSWETFQAQPDDLVLHLDPGQAFGTGLHASTRLVLHGMQELADRGGSVSRFLDLGTGSGILAIAAIRLWPQCTGVAVDIEPLALAAAAENAASNNVAEQIECLASATEPTGHFDLVLANIQSDVLLDNHPLIAPRVAVGGTLLLSGLLTTQVEAVAARYAETRYEDDSALVTEEIRASADDPEWSSARLRRIG